MMKVELILRLALTYYSIQLTLKRYHLNIVSYFNSLIVLDRELKG